MTSRRPRTALRTFTKTYRIGGVIAVALGLTCYLIGRAFDSGFVSGLFDGMTIALSVMGAYLIGASTWQARKSEKDLQEGRHWLPSRDSNSGQEDH